ncbi:GspH/FimT family pseudopilin [Tamilnaduibacter salinus]|uniref:GspH/FimT family pseudopilin n=1 Tax=Tamilnaduibacter salinus TaxID=1484056 RepID=UPI001303FA7C|nr:GspH/FimT family pseudopilin [Tamilnaduibacter salinus]
MNTPTSPSGFSLIELITALTILVIVSSAAISAGTQFVQANRHQTLIAGYFSAFQFARAKAATKRDVVTLCPLDTTNTCHDDWEKPVAVFPDANKDRQPDNNVVWRELEAPPEAFRVRSRTGGKGYFRFGMTGMTHGLSGSIVVCPNREKTGLMTYLALNQGGRLRRTLDRNRDDSITLPWGLKIGC